MLDEDSISLMLNGKRSDAVLGRHETDGCNIAGLNLRRTPTSGAEFSRKSSAFCVSKSKEETVLSDSAHLILQPSLTNATYSPSPQSWTSTGQCETRSQAQFDCTNILKDDAPSSKTVQSSLCPFMLYFSNARHFPSRSTSEQSKSEISEKLQSYLQPDHLLFLDNSPMSMQTSASQDCYDVTKDVASKSHQSLYKNGALPERSSSSGNRSQCSERLYDTQASDTYLHFTKCTQSEVESMRLSPDLPNMASSASRYTDLENTPPSHDDMNDTQLTAKDPNLNTSGASSVRNLDGTAHRKLPRALAVMTGPLYRRLKHQCFLPVNQQSGTLDNRQKIVDQTRRRSDEKPAQTFIAASENRSFVQRCQKFKNTKGSLTQSFAASSEDVTMDPPIRSIALATIPCLQGALGIRPNKTIISKPKKEEESNEFEAEQFQSLSHDVEENSRLAQRQEARGTCWNCIMGWGTGAGVSLHWSILWKIVQKMKAQQLYPTNRSMNGQFDTSSYMLSALMSTLKDNGVLDLDNTHTSVLKTSDFFKSNDDFQQLNRNTFGEDQHFLDYEKASLAGPSLPNEPLLNSKSEIPISQKCAVNIVAACDNLSKYSDSEGSMLQKQLEYQLCIMMLRQFLRVARSIRITAQAVSEHITESFLLEEGDHCASFPNCSDRFDAECKIEGAKNLSSVSSQSAYNAELKISSTPPKTSKSVNSININLALEKLGISKRSCVENKSASAFDVSQRQISPKSVTETLHDSLYNNRKMTLSTNATISTATSTGTASLTSSSSDAISLQRDSLSYDYLRNEWSYVYCSQHDMNSKLVPSQCTSLSSSHLTKIHSEKKLTSDHVSLAAASSPKFCDKSKSQAISRDEACLSSKEKSSDVSRNQSCSVSCKASSSPCLTAAFMEVVFFVENLMIALRKPSSCEGLDISKSKSCIKEKTSVPMTAYWIVLTAFELEKKLHHVARKSQDLTLYHNYCFCRLFTVEDFKLARQYTQAQHLSSKARPSCRAVENYHLNRNFENRAQCASQHSSNNYDKESELGNCKSFLDFFREFEQPHINDAGISLSSHIGSQIDTLRRFLIICFCAWSWVEDEKVTSSALIKIIEQIWWSANTFISHQIAKQKTASRVQSENNSKNRNGSTTSRARGSQRLWGELAVQKLFGSRAPAGVNVPSEVKSLNPLKAGGDQVADFYKEYLNLPTCATSMDFQAQIFQLLKSFKYTLDISTESILALSRSWLASLDKEDCCVRHCDFADVKTPAFAS